MTRIINVIFLHSNVSLNAYGYAPLLSVFQCFSNRRLNPQVSPVPAFAWVWVGVGVGVEYEGVDC